MVRAADDSGINKWACLICDLLLPHLASYRAARSHSRVVGLFCLSEHALSLLFSTCDWRLNHRVPVTA